MVGMEYSRLLETARRAAAAAADVHRRHLRSFGVDAWQSKGPLDFVTHVDREAEGRILEIVRGAFPDHDILAEEESSDRPAADAAARPAWQWVIDPLDGTTNYLHGYPVYAVSIAVLRAGVPVVGVVLNTVSGEEWHAVAGGGAFRNGDRICVSSIRELPQSLIGTGFPFKVPELIPEYLGQLDVLLRKTSGVRRAGSAALDLCHVASGWLDGFWELSLAPWDVAAGTLLVREAGGSITRMDGSTDVVGHGSILAGNAHIYAALRSALAGSEPREG